MKMQKKHDLLAAILAKEQGIGAILAFCNGDAADIMAVRLKTVIDATMCAIIA